MAAGAVDDLQDPCDDRRFGISGDDQVPYDHDVGVGGFVEERPEAVVAVPALYVTGDVQFGHHVHPLARCSFSSRWGRNSSASRSASTIRRLGSTRSACGRLPVASTPCCGHKTRAERELPRAGQMSWRAHR